MTEQPGQLIVVSGPSGVGKSTLIAQLMSEYPDLAFSVSHTTRPKRQGEEDGVHYHFVTREEFERMIEGGEFLEYTEYMGNYYGTGREAVNRLRAEGKSVLLDIEVQGAAQVRGRAKDAVSIFVIPPSFEELSRRLRGRNTDSEEKIRGRLEKARVEYREIPHYDYLVVNSTVTEAVEELASILRAESCRVRNRMRYYEAVCL